MDVKAYRRTDPNQSTTTTVKIKIISGNNPPVFTESFKRVTIPDDFSMGRVILTVKANDQDQVSFFFILAVATTFFFINPSVSYKFIYLN